MDQPIPRAASLPALEVLWRFWIWVSCRRGWAWDLDPFDPFYDWNSWRHPPSHLKRTVHHHGSADRAFWISGRYAEAVSRKFIKRFIYQMLLFAIQRCPMETEQLNIRVPKELVADLEVISK